METSDLLSLLTKQQNNLLNDREKNELEEWYATLDVEQKDLINKDISNNGLIEEMLTGFHDLKSKRTIVRKMGFNQKILRWAAIFIGISLTGVLCLFLNSPKPNNITAQQKKINIDIEAPKTNNAVLTLGNGIKIDLGNTSTGVLATDGNEDITKNGDDQLVYNGKDANELSYNTLTIPEGSKPMKILLADGTSVWLNVASSITFPVVFIGKERRVQITGEAYFEVAKNAAVPFHVTHNNLDVKVLGTHFNVNTYADEKDIKVTLLEGAVSVSKGILNGLLKPGQQSKINAENLQVINDANLNEVMAWKNNLFYFEGADIKTVMRQIGKWYNVEVEYNDSINYAFVAKISRNENVSQLLNTLELTGLVHFKIEKNKITVLK